MAFQVPISPRHSITQQRKGKPQAVCTNCSLRLPNPPRSPDSSRSCLKAHISDSLAWGTNKTAEFQFFWQFRVSIALFHRLHTWMDYTLHYTTGKSSSKLWATANPAEARPFFPQRCSPNIFSPQTTTPRWTSHGDISKAMLCCRRARPTRSHWDDPPGSPAPGNPRSLGPWDQLAFDSKTEPSKGLLAENHWCSSMFHPLGSWSMFIFGSSKDFPLGSNSSTPCRDIGHPLHSQGPVDTPESEWMSHELWAIQHTCGTWTIKQVTEVPWCLMTCEEPHDFLLNPHLQLPGHIAVSLPKEEIRHSHRQSRVDHIASDAAPLGRLLGRLLCRFAKLVGLASHPPLMEYKRNCNLPQPNVLQAQETLGTFRSPFI